MKKIFISQPTNGKSEKEILKERNMMIKTVKNFFNEEVEILDTIIKEEPPKNVNASLWCLSKSLKMLSEADVAVFFTGWDSARGCRIEYSCANYYGIKILKFGGDVDV